jgi:hypothetical protein
LSLDAVLQMGYNSSFVLEQTMALPVKSDVFTYLMSKAKQWGLLVYEQV